MSSLVRGDVCLFCLLGFFVPVLVCYWTFSLLNFHLLSNSSRSDDRPCHEIDRQSLQKKQKHFSFAKCNVSRPGFHSKIHQMLHLPQKVTLELHILLPLPLTLLYSTLLDCTLLDPALLYCILLDSSLLDATLLASTLLYSTRLDATLLDSTLLDFTQMLLDFTGMLLVYRKLLS